MNTKKVKTFLKSLDDLEFHYLEIMLNLVKAIKYIVKESGYSKEEFCKKLEITNSSYENFISGNYEYKLTHIAVINVLYIEIETKIAKSKSLINVATNS